MNYIITKNPEYFKKIGQYNYCSLEQLNTLPNEIAFDSETTGLFAKEEDMFCCQIGDGTNNYIVHMYDDNYTFYDVIPYLKGKVFVMQNGLFDIGFMYKYNFTNFTVRDTMLATRIVYNGQYFNKRSDFQAIMKRELDVWYDKTTQKNIHLLKLSNAAAIKYSFNDVDKLMEAHDVLMEKIKKQDQLETYNLHCRFIKALAYMEQCGLPIKPEKWLYKMDYDKNKVQECKKIIGEYIYDNVPKYREIQTDLFKAFEKNTYLNLNSNPQMIPVFEALGIKIKDKKGKDSIAKDIISKSGHEFVKLWLDFKEYQHRVSTFGQNVYDRIKDGRIYTNFNPMVDTSRLSSRKGSINFLNFSSDKETRDCFECVPGNKMVVCDWSGQETVISADVSKDVAMTKSVVEGADLHCLLTRELFPELKPMDDETIIEHHSDKRKKAKAPRFAMSYGGNAYTLHVNENIPLKEAEEIFQKFIKLHEGLFEWGEQQLQLALKRGYIKSTAGWRLYLSHFDKFKELEDIIKKMTKEDWQRYRVGKEERRREFMIMDKNSKRKPDEKEIVFKCINIDAYDYYRKIRPKVSEYFSLKSGYSRLALNNPVQTCGSHQMKLALCLIFEWILENDLMWTVLMCNAVHDETVLESPEELAEMVRDKVGEFMRKAGDYYLEDLKIKADANIGQSWWEAK